MSNVVIRISERKTLSVPEFCEYSGLKKTTALNFAREHGLLIRISERVYLIDKIKYDEWCKQKVLPMVGASSSVSSYRRMKRGACKP